MSSINKSDPFMWHLLVNTVDKRPHITQQLVFPSQWRDTNSISLPINNFYTARQLWTECPSYLSCLVSPCIWLYSDSDAFFFLSVPLGNSTGRLWSYIFMFFRGKTAVGRLLRKWYRTNRQNQLKWLTRTIYWTTPIKRIKLWLTLIQC